MGKPEKSSLPKRPLKAIEDNKVVKTMNAIPAGFELCNPTEVESRYSIQLELWGTRSPGGCSLVATRNMKHMKIRLLRQAPSETLSGRSA